MSKLTDAFKELCGVTRVRPEQAESGVEAMTRRVFKVLGEFPEPVALTALDLWPRRSEWFPTEKELRDLLEEVSAEAEREAMARGKTDGGLYRQPVGTTMQFVERVRAVRGEGYCKSWLAGGITCFFSNTRIFTTRIGVERLSRDFGALAEEMGVEIRYSEDAAAALRRYCDDRGLVFEAPAKRRGR